MCLSASVLGVYGPFGKSPVAGENGLPRWLWGDIGPMLGCYDPNVQRCAGLLLHPTSLTSRFGIGDLGPAAERFLDWAEAAGQSLWQVLPLGPPSGFYSPYNALSAFAGNPLLISPEGLFEDGLLDRADLDSWDHEPADRVDFAAVGSWKETQHRKAFTAFRKGGSFRGSSGLQDLQDELDVFRSAQEQACWLRDWCLFATLHRRFSGQSWWTWPKEFAFREPWALEQVFQDDRDEVDYHCFLQFILARQWKRLRTSAAKRNIQLLGDLPIYVSGHSADVWANRHLFELEPDGTASAVAGVPPDAFAEDGQLWGNPLYRWGRMAEDQYRWWGDRLEQNLRFTDLVRLDHFRGFAAYWRVPAGAETARRGQWVEGPGKAFFDALRERFGDLPIVAEDLGVITDDVRQLRQETSLPGMKVLQFGFDDPNSEHAPHRVEKDSLVYTGTHDNDTSLGWFSSLDSVLQERVLQTIGAEAHEFSWFFIQAAYETRGSAAIVPVQDVLGLGTEARMNTPGTTTSNWSWRLLPGSLTSSAASRLRGLVEMTGRSVPLASPEPSRAGSVVRRPSSTE